MGIIFNGCDMGTMEEAESALAEKARVYRDHRQPVVASAAQIKAHNAREHEARFQCANAALHWLWHREHALQAATAGDERRHVTKISVGRATTSRTGPTKYEHFVIIHNNAGQDFSQHMRHKPEEALFLAMELALFMGVPCDPLSIDGKQIELDDMLKSMLPDEPDDEALSRHKDDAGKVTEAMVERALTAWYPGEWGIDEKLMADDVFVSTARKDMRAALQAALAPTEGE